MVRGEQMKKENKMDFLKQNQIDFFLNRGYTLDIEEENQAIIDDQDLFFDELKIEGIWSYYKSGCSTAIFENDEGDKIIGFSLDLPKIDFMINAYLPGFKILGVVEYVPDRFMIVYEMDKLNFISKHNNEELYYSCENIIDITRDPSQRLDDENVVEVFNDIAQVDADMVNDILDKYKEFAMLDIHVGQFMIDSNNDVWLIDPVISSNIDF